MPIILLQILLIPILASAVIFISRRWLGRASGWIVSLALLYATFLAALAAIEVSSGRIITEQYLLIAPGIRLGLLADGLSIPVLVVVLLLCTALSFYSIYYVKHRITVLYEKETEQVKIEHYARFFYLFPFFPVGFIGTILSTNLVSLYFFMEVLTITLFFLMAFFGYRERVRVAFTSLSWGIIGALFFLVASLVVYNQLGSLEISNLSQFSGTRFTTLAIVLFLNRLDDKTSNGAIPCLDAMGTCRTSNLYRRSSSRICQPGTLRHRASHCPPIKRRL